MNWIESNGGWAIGAALVLAALSESIIEWVARVC
jgi:hypothetical protein